MPTANELGISSVQQVLEEVLGIEGRERGNEFDITCPDPKHNDRHPSCGVNLDTGLWYCFSCGAKGDLADLAALVLGLSRENVITKLKRPTPEAMIVGIQNKLRRVLHGRDKKQRSPLAVHSLPKRAGVRLDYLVRRGFSDRTLEDYGVCYCKSQSFEGNNGTYTLRDAIAIPIRDRSGNNIAWCYRSTDKSPKWQPRYIYTPGAPLAELWFGVDLVQRAEHVVVCEGPLDAMWVHQAGYPALAMMGGSARPSKLRQLERFRKVVLFFDRDHAGLRATNKVGKELEYRANVAIARYPSYTTGKDPQDLAAVDVEIAIERAVHWRKWKSLTQSAGN